MEDSEYMSPLLSNITRDFEETRLSRIRKALSEFNIRNAVEKKLHRLGTYAKLGFAAPLLLMMSLGMRPRDFLDFNLPVPLSPEDESEYIRMMIDTGSENARRVLIEHNLRLVAYMVQRFKNTGIWFEDLFQVGAVGLIKSVDTFDPQKKVKFTSYATRCIKNEILMFLRRQGKYQRTSHLSDPINVDSEGNALTLSDVLEGNVSIESSVMDAETLDELHKILNSSALSSREKKIIEMRYGFNEQGMRKTQKEVSSILGLTQSYISRIEKRIIRKLRREFKRKYA